MTLDFIGLKILKSTGNDRCLLSNSYLCAPGTKPGKTKPSFIMALQAGIVGLPNVGKSTLFNAVSNSAKAQASNYRFCTIDPNVGLVDVPDTRLTKLAELVQPEKVIPTQIEIVDIAGLVRGASKEKDWEINF